MTEKAGSREQGAGSREQRGREENEVGETMSN
jgi:hypothetical protein